MQYCFNYNKLTEKSKYINEIPEWTIKYNNKDNTLLDFLDLHKDKRINLYIENLDIEISFLQELLNKYDNLYLKLSILYYDIIKEDNNLFNRFFFETQVNDWETFNGLCKWGVSDIYITGNLCFELDKIAAAAIKNNINLRIYPNIAQYTWEEINPLKTFFIRPEDIEKYGEFLNNVTFEFYDVDKKIDIYYEIYNNDKKWFGKLNEIIDDFNSDIDNKYIIPRFTKKRLTCGRKCLKGNNCNRCDEIEKLAKKLEEVGLIIKIDNK